MQNTLSRNHIETIYTDDNAAGQIPDLHGRPVIVFCDFDGTVTTSDVTDVLLEELAAPEWKIIEARWVNGEIDDCECMSQQFSLINGNWNNIVAVADTIGIDPYFRAFVAQCQSANIPVYIGSNGADTVMQYILDREQISFDGYWAYRLIESNDKWFLEFPQDEQRGICQAPKSIACKCALVERSLARWRSNQGNLLMKNTIPYKIVIGDSRSDFCWTHKADLVFAKGKLAQYCWQQNINCLSFSDFSQINECLKNAQIFDYHTAD